MRYFLALVFVLLINGKVLADAAVTIFVKETSYLINSSDEKLNLAELESKLKQLKFSEVTLDVDYCAGPEMIVEVYVALANVNPSVKDVHLKASGSHEESKCKNV